VNGVVASRPRTGLVSYFAHVQAYRVRPYPLNLGTKFNLHVVPPGYPLDLGTLP
jgi:hypothetical protein